MKSLNLSLLNSTIAREIFLSLLNRKMNNSDIAHNGRVTYSHVHKILHLLMGKRLVKREKINNREYINELTPKGREIAIKIREIEELLK
jgi:predicted transcriptional regulator